MNRPLHSHQGFKFAMITLVGIIIFISLHLLVANNILAIDVYTYLSSFVVVLVFVTTITGCVYSLRGLKDPYSLKKLLALVVNLLLMLLLIGTIVANLIDVKNALN
ncbi:MAG: hypothetical protein GYB32_02705 [Algicola sp.]|nr:hypothetical protein [Algicola sp.]